VPMHRWAQSQMFRSLALYQREQRMADSSKLRQRETKCVE